MKKFIIILLAVAVIGITGCEEWLDVNKNPNDATQATPDLILPAVLNGLLSSQLDFSTTPGAWMGYWYHAGGWSGWYEVKKYDISSNFYNAFGYYTGQLTDTKFIRENCGDNLIYPAITNVVDAWYYARLVDLYGDVPYSEACSPGVTFNPKYDDDEEIYLSLIHRLNQSIAVFDKAVTDPTAAADPRYTFVKSGDIIFNGDLTKWKQLANTYKLRMVMKISNTQTAAHWKTEMDSTVAHGFITETVKGNPGYSVSSGKTNPWYSTYGYSYNGTRADPNTQYCLNAYVYEKLTRLDDPRLTQYFWAPTAALGVLKATVFGKDGSLIEQPNVTVAGNYSHVFIANDYTGPTGNPLRNSGSGHTDPARLFLASESYFLQAEARVRGIITTGLTAEAAYTAGITASLNESKVPAAAQTEYLDPENADIVWDPAWTTAQQIQHIINQKWIANFFLNMFESWCDYRRTGYPNPLHPGYTIDPTEDPKSEMLSYYPSGIIRRQIPRIIPYPQTEFDLNKDQVQAAVDKQNAANGTTFINTSYPFDARIFWDTAPKTITY